MTCLQEPRSAPDIYYIILDRYANVDTLRELYDFDNEPFLRELEARGFTRGARTPGRTTSRRRSPSTAR